MAEQPAEQPPAPEAAVQYVLPGLFDERIDREHRSYLSAICGTPLGTVRARTPGHFMPLDARWIPKYVIQYLINVNIQLYFSLH